MPGTLPDKKAKKNGIIFTDDAENRKTGLGPSGPGGVTRNACIIAGTMNVRATPARIFGNPGETRFPMPETTIWKHISEGHQYFNHKHRPTGYKGL
ncbi:MAG: hypothetical protein ABID63_14120 [Pseudomonadota bacterium]